MWHEDRWEGAWDSTVRVLEPEKAGHSRELRTLVEHLPGASHLNNHVLREKLCGVKAQRGGSAKLFVNKVAPAVGTPRCNGALPPKHTAYK